MDKGIVGIMKLHQWRVGSLIELSPAEKSILGYNRNKGQLIALRLRTDDLEGFRHYDAVRKVLLHELAHNVSCPKVSYIEVLHESIYDGLL